MCITPSVLFVKNYQFSIPRRSANVQYVYCLLYTSYLENRDFTPQTYFRLKVTAEKDGTPFAAISELRYETLPAANAALAAVTATGTVQVADVQRCV